jgi:chitin disaccharide deacetylase
MSSAALGGRLSAGSQGDSLQLAAKTSASPNRKRLIVNADDLGLSRGITDGIFFAHQQGIVTSASYMVNQPASEYAAEQLQNYPSLDVGIHLNLCQGRPVLPPSAVPTLVGSDGCFLPPSRMARRLTLWRASSKEILNEFCAQIDRMMAAGLMPSHADSHHRFHFYPAAAMAFEKAVRSRGICRARAARKVFWPANGSASKAHAGSYLRRRSVYAYNEFLQMVVFRNLKLPDAGVALHPAFRGKLQELPAAWNLTVRNMPAGTYEIWCHPGFPEAGFSETDHLSKQRELEIKILTDPALGANVHNSGIELTAFAQL